MGAQVSVSVRGRGEGECEGEMSGVRFYAQGGDVIGWYQNFPGRPINTLASFPQLPVKHSVAQNLSGPQSASLTQ